MSDPFDILVLGTGPFAQRIVCDLAATAGKPLRLLVAGRNAERLAWIRTAANARAQMYARPVVVDERGIDLAHTEAIVALIASSRPKVVVQAASLQGAAVIAAAGNGWARLVAEGGLSATAVFHAVLSTRVARAVQHAAPTCHLINCCFPDVVNGMIAAAGLPITCGVGNIAILAHAFAGELARATMPAPPPRLHVLAHYQSIGLWRRPPSARAGRTARVWIDGAELADVIDRFRAVQLTPEPVIDISGAAGGPLMAALAHGEPWRGHVPGPLGLPGGYPVALEGGALRLDLPAGLSQADAVAWNAGHEADNGLTITPDGEARFSGRLHEALARSSPVLAAGFHVRDLEVAHAEMHALRDRLMRAS